MFDWLKSFLPSWIGGNGGRAPQAAPQLQTVGDAQAAISGTVSLAQEIMPHDSFLLDRAQTQWQFGDWVALAKLWGDEVQRHPERARLALLVAAAHTQLGNLVRARELTEIARDWGCSPKMMAQLLTSGVHNSLGRAAAATGQQARAVGHFASAIKSGAPGSDMPQLRTARINEQLKQLQATSGLDLGAPALPGEGKTAQASDTGRLTWTAMSTVRSIHHFACTGGTLLAKCLAALPGVVVLNELDPQSRMGLDASNKSKFTPRDIISLLHQSSKVDDDELVNELFLSDLQIAGRRLAPRGQMLLLRDHTHSAYLNGTKPRGGVTLRKTLGSRFVVHSILTVRNPIDSYLSLQFNKWIHFEPASFEEYCLRYLTFLDNYQGVKVFRYEDFVAQPLEVMREMCQVLRLQFDASFVEQFSKFNFSGDSGRKGDVVEPRSRREFNEAFAAEVNASSAFQALAYRLGYPEGLEVPERDRADEDAAGNKKF